MALLETVLAILLVVIAAIIVWRIFKKLIFATALFIILLAVLYVLGIIAF